MDPLAASLPPSKKPDNGSDTHRGPYLDAQLGLGALWVGTGVDLLSGVSSSLGVSVGYAPRRDLALFVEFYDLTVSSPAFAYADLNSVALYGLGPGLRYFLSPNYFLSGSLLLSRLRLHGERVDLPYPVAIDETSGWGVTARIGVGGERRLSTGWSIGLRGDLLLGRMGNGSLLPRDHHYLPAGFSLLVSGRYHPGAANPTPFPPNARHTHDGLYLHFSLGAGWTRMKNALVTDGVSFLASGQGFPISLAAGYSFGRNLVLFGEFGAMYGRHLSGDQGLSHLAWHGLGPGFRYYLLPTNHFLSGSLLASRVTASHSGAAFDHASAWGLTGRFSWGKEWWVADSWALGLAGEVMLGWMEGRDIQGTYTVEALSLLTSASFN